MAHNIGPPNNMQCVHTLNHVANFVKNVLLKNPKLQQKLFLDNMFIY